jgi:hypothetical protein
VEASRATVQEIGILPPTPSFRSRFDTDRKSEIEDGTKEQTHGDEEQSLKQFFMHPPKCKKQSSPSPKSKPRQRLLISGSIFATCSENNNVRFYQVVDIQSSLGQDNDISTTWRAYSVSPSTHLTLVGSSSSNDGQSENHPGSTWRLPRPSLVASFLQSLQDARGSMEDQIDNQDTMDMEKSGLVPSSYEICHPSASEVADALYLQSSSLSTRPCHVCGQSNTKQILHPRIVNLVGGEDNHVSACVQEASDISKFISYFYVVSLFILF